MAYRSRLAVLIIMAASPCIALAADPDPGNPSMGQPPPGPTEAPPQSQTEAPPMFSEMDHNHDGQISKKEAKDSAYLSTHFKQLDTNKDHRISVSEWLADEKAQQLESGPRSDTPTPAPTTPPEGSTTPGNPGDRPPMNPGAY